MRTVVTGAAGFIGSHLCERLLARGDEVVGIDGFVDYYPRAIKEGNLAGAREHRSFEFHEGMLQDLDLGPLVDGADCVFHLAAQAGVRASWGREFEAYTNHNVLATQRLLEAAASKQIPKVVFASSSSVYGNSKELPLRETSECRPVSPYGVTKLACEQLAYLYGLDRGLSVVALRYFTVYGPRQRPDMAFHRFLKAARDATPIRLFGDGRQTRDFTFISDIIEATLCAAARGRAGGIYNIGGGNRIALNDVLKKIASITETELDIQRETSQPGDMRDTHADSRSAEADLGFRSTVSLDDGLAREWAWLRGAV